MSKTAGISYENILGFHVVNSELSNCVNEILTRIRNNGSQCYLVCANPHGLEAAQKDYLFRNALRDANIIIPDGIGIIIASRLFGGAIRQRITGSDIFWEVNKLLNDGNGHSCFFLGSAEKTLHKINKKMGIDFPNIKVVGTFSPPFKKDFTDDENDLMVKAINKANPDILWVGMTAPKQEKWIYQNKDKLNVKFIGAIGAVFDFYAGSKKRSHPWFQKNGLEWLPRLLREPRRLWRRNFISGPKFLFRIIRHKFGLFM